MLGAGDKIAGGLGCETVELVGNDPAVDRHRHRLGYGRKCQERVGVAAVQVLGAIVVQYGVWIGLVDRDALHVAAEGDDQFAQPSGSISSRISGST